MLRTFLCVCVFLFLAPAARAQSPFKTIPTSDKIHRIVDNECTINGEYVKRVSLSKDNRLSILYMNRTARPVRPEATFIVLDKYGLPIKRTQDKWITSLDKGETRSQDRFFEEIDIELLLRCTTVPVPEDAGEPMFVFVQEFSE
ncbi:MAG: hypothetical protein R3C99_10320 [Pirellulaceae bacterium]